MFDWAFFSETLLEIQILRLRVDCNHVHAMLSESILRRPLFFLFFCSSCPPCPPHAPLLPCVACLAPPLACPAWRSVPPALPAWFQGWRVNFSAFDFSDGDCSSLNALSHILFYSNLADLGCDLFSPLLLHGFQSFCRCRCSCERVLIHQEYIAPQLHEQLGNLACWQC